MSRITIIKDELDNDPEGIGYAGMADADVVVALNAINRTRNKASITGAEAFYLTDSGEYAGLTADRKNEWLSLCAILEHDPFGVSADIALAIFGGGSATITALANYRVEPISRGQELGVGEVVLGDVEAARGMV